MGRNDLREDDISAELDFEAQFGAESADAYRSVISTLLTTGSLPDRAGIRPEHQTVLPVGQDALLKAVYGLDPAAEAAKVKVPTFVVSGKQSTLVNPVDGDRLKAALPSAQAVSVDAAHTTTTILMRSWYQPSPAASVALRCPALLVRCRLLAGQ